jgi:hypothetical protein
MTRVRRLRKHGVKKGLEWYDDANEGVNAVGTCEAGIDCRK